MANKPLEESEIAERVAALPTPWERDGSALRATFQFDSFVAAFGWMSKVALVAEKLDHHPDWKNVYNRVDVELSSHDIGALSEKDFRLAREMSRLAG